MLLSEAKFIHYIAKFGVDVLLGKAVLFQAIIVLAGVGSIAALFFR